MGALMKKLYMENKNKQFFVLELQNILKCSNNTAEEVYNLCQKGMYKEAEYSAQMNDWI